MNLLIQYRFLMKNYLLDTKTHRRRIADSDLTKLNPHEFKLILEEGN